MIREKNGRFKENNNVLSKEEIIEIYKRGETLREFCKGTNINLIRSYKILKENQDELNQAIIKHLKIVVDDSDYKKITPYLWRLSSQGYPRTTINGERLLLHQFIYGKLSKKDKKEIDHINGNPLDNRRCNLRIASFRQNVVNSKDRKRIYSKYKGVTCSPTEKRKKIWKASCEFDNKNIYLGRFHSEEEAGLSYNKKAKELWGDFARLNPIPI